jgi:hypothetical protein
MLPRCSRLGVLIACSAIAVAAGSPAVASAQDSTETGQDERGSAEYRRLIEQALSEYRLRNFEEARALFARAHARYPNARTLRGMALVEFELRNYVESAEYFRRALASNVRPLEGALRTETETLLSRTETFIGRVALTIEPAGAALRVDGVPLDRPVSGVLALRVGDHVIEAQAAGYASERREIRLVGRDELAVRIVLQPTAGAASGERAPEVASAREPADEPESRGSAWPWVVIGGSGALLIAGGVLLVMAQYDIDRIEGAPPGARWSTVAGGYDASPVKSAAGFALLGVGAVGLALGIVWKVGEGDGAAEARLAWEGERIVLGGTF